jgi:hypothetical protein
MNKLKQAGFSVVEIVLVIVLLGIVGFVGYRVYDANKNDDSTTPEVTQTDPTAATDVGTAPAVETASDLGEALEVLDATDPSGSNVTDADTIDSDVAEF